MQTEAKEAAPLLKVRLPDGTVVRRASAHEVAAVVRCRRRRCKGVFAESVLKSIEDGSELNEGKEGGSKFVVVSAKPAMTLAAAENVFDAMTVAITRAGEGA